MSKPYGEQILEALIRRGHVWVDGNEYVGKASDGVEVRLGSVGEERILGVYLLTHRTPDTW